jgi:uncharacterized membrane protein
MSPISPPRETRPSRAYLILKYLHIIGASVLLGTGAGIAFFMLLAHRTGDPRAIAGVARIVVIADYLFTASAVVLQRSPARLSSGLSAIPSWRGGFCCLFFSMR